METSVGVIELQQNEVAAVSGGYWLSFGGSLLAVAGVALWKGTGGFTGDYVVSLAAFSKPAAAIKYFSEKGNLKKTTFAIIAFAVATYGCRAVMGGGVEMIAGAIFG